MLNERERERDVHLNYNNGLLLLFVFYRLYGLLPLHKMMNNFLLFINHILFLEVLRTEIYTAILERPIIWKNWMTVLVANIYIIFWLDCFKCLAEARAC